MPDGVTTLHPAFMNMKFVISILVLLLSSAFCRAQKQSLMFEKTWGLDSPMFTNFITYVDQQSNGDYFMIGTKSTDFWSTYQHYACRTDSTGSILWEEAWGIPDSRCQFSMAIKLEDETYMAVGRGVSGMGGGISNMTATRIDANGTILFTKYYDFAYEDFGYSIIPTFDDHFIFSGAAGNGSGTAQPAFIKIDENGNEIWRRTQSSLVDYRPFHLSQAADSGFVVLGQTESYNNCFYAKYDSLGMMEWIRYPFGLGDTIGNNPGAIQGNADGTFDAVYRLDWFSIGEPTSLLVHYDDQGNTLWNKSYFDPIGSFFVRAADSTFCCMLGAGQAFCEMNSDYEFEAKTSGISSGPYLYRFFPTNDGGYIGCGRVSNPNPSNQFYVVKFSPDGRYQADPFLSLITISPNPSSDGNITVSFDVQTDENVHVRVIAMDGRLVYYDEIYCPAGSHTELPIRLDDASANAGMYIIEVKTDGEYRRERILVTRNTE